MRYRKALNGLERNNEKMSVGLNDHGHFCLPHQFSSIFFVFVVIERVRFSDHGCFVKVLSCNDLLVQNPLLNVSLENLGGKVPFKKCSRHLRDANFGTSSRPSLSGDKV